MKTILVLNGPNLNLLGTREPGVYGTQTLADVEALCAQACAAHNFKLDFRQSNHEGVLVDWLQEARQAAGGVVLNAGAFTHTSVALHDALKAVDLPVIEVHISNPYKRETFRHTSFVSPVVTGVICGLGAQGYCLAIEALAALIASPSSKKGQG